jgi:hypothetical protein
MTTDRNERIIINALYTEIGRGHSFYLDGIVQCLQKEYSDRIKVNIIDALSLSHGFSKGCWKVIERVYRFGGRGGIVSRPYDIIRGLRKPNKFGLAGAILSRDIRYYLKNNSFPTVVSHPILVPLISDMVPVYYQHGEIAVPDEAAVIGAKAIFVPLDVCSNRLSTRGLSRDNIFVSGLCIESELAKKASLFFHRRIERLKGNKPPFGAFFSSGAEPPGHIKKIILMIQSLHKNNQKAIVFYRQGGRLDRELKTLSFAIESGMEGKSSASGESLAAGDIIKVSFRNRREENEAAIRWFGEFDYFVSPSHERTNWAVGLGLPIFILHPIIGPFSPQNRDFLIERRVGYDIETADKAMAFSDILRQMQLNGILGNMAQSGFGKYDLGGFSAIAQRLQDNLHQS